VFSTVYNTPRFFEWRTWSDEYQRPCESTFQGTIVSEWLLKYLAIVEKHDLLKQVHELNIFRGLVLLSDYVNSTSKEALDNQGNPTKQSDYANCTESVRNVTLIATSLRRNHAYVLVRVKHQIFYSAVKVGDLN